ncbi:MAG: hypothetical protein AB7V62_15195 [Thermoleophilia bacterium]
MLIDRDELEGIVAGRITALYRRWTRPTVRSGGTLRTAAGVMAIEAVTPVAEGDITEADARAAGFAGRDALLAFLARRDTGRVHRIDLRLAGPDPRVALRARSDLDPAEAAEVIARLDAMDRRAKDGPWTRATLALIADRPGVRASELAAAAGRETPPFKRDVRKLKELGLTESLEVGYRLSPRGAAVRAADGGPAASARG